ncbi:hypothetical protein C9374_010792 [Naegleria lovaniensis]|uniref:Uncharacterized protein n=1 Tax=Naegleria lovaniensis TaxID=51637 RepID=A0AA88KDX0_NAELO|nr:uncharacterized protein C9374_010792 [Naegleria lovaniensis]KAG2374508.1 hypothetical protein C9374_010792 [Naegleria lovaniensis]
MGQPQSNGQNATLLTCGHNHGGQCITDDFVDVFQLHKVKLPFPDWVETGNSLTRTKVKKAIRIKKTSCGASHLLLLTNRLNEVYVVGKNTEFQLGLSHNKPVKDLTKLDTNRFLQRGEKIYDLYGGTLVSYIIARKINNSSSSDHPSSSATSSGTSNLSSNDCGGDSIYWCGTPPLQNLYAHASHVSSVGDGSPGIMGGTTSLNSGSATSSTMTSNLASPSPAQLIANVSFTRWTPEEGWKKNFKVKCFDCSKVGDDHCIVVNQFNQIFGRGSNAYHQYGRNLEGQSFAKLTEIKLRGYEHQPPNVKLVACGGYHSVIVLHNNEYFCSGLNCHGQLGYDVDSTIFDFAQPKDLPFAGREITNVALGLYHTVVVVDHCDVFVCGDGRYGQLGNGENKSVNSTFIRLKLEAISPVTGNYIKHINTFVTGLSCGLTHTVLITSDRKVWRCGGNDFGQIFLPNELQTCSFRVVFEPRCEINQVSCGGKFTALYLQKKVNFYEYNIVRHMNIYQDKQNMAEYYDLSIRCLK